MIAGTYTLDLYCENKDPAARTMIDNFGHRHGEFPHQYTGEMGSDCRARARRAGWKLNLKTGEAWCPKCSGKLGGADHG